MTEHEPGKASLADILFAWRRLLVVVTGFVAVVAVVVSLLLPSWYASTAVVLPPEEESSALGFLDMFSQFGRGGGLGGAGSAAKRLLSRSPAVDLMLGVLKSRRLRADIVDRFGLQEIYDSKTREHAIKELGRHVEVGTTPEGLISIRVEDRDKERAAAIANTFVELLDRFNRETSVESARRTLEFIDGALAENRKRLDEASTRMREYMETHGAINLSEQTRVTVEAMAELEVEQHTLEIRKRVLERYAAPDQREVQRLEAQIEEIERSIERLRGTAPPPATEPDPASGDLGGTDDRARRGDYEGVFLALTDLPSIGLEFAELKREVLVQEKVYELLTAQYEEARIRQARDQTTITVLDEAVPPPRKARPRRSLLVLASVFLAFAGTVAFVLVAETVVEASEGGSGGSELRSGLRPLALRLRRIRDWSSRRSKSPDA